jgi:hypothetical protein
MVSAWATANHIRLGQVVVDAKSDEITAIPKRLRLLELSGGLVTIDAMGCRTEIAQRVVTAGADDVLAVKGNPPALYEGIVGSFLDHLEDDFARVRVSRHDTPRHDGARAGAAGAPLVLRPRGPRGPARPRPLAGAGGDRGGAQRHGARGRVLRRRAV